MENMKIRMMLPIITSAIESMNHGFLHQGGVTEIVKIEMGSVQLPSCVVQETVMS